MRVLEVGRVGATYNIGGESERQNLEVVEEICTILDRLRPRADGESYRRQIEFVPDRPGHDRRYAIDISTISEELGRTPKESSERRLVKTVEWYVVHEEGWGRSRSEEHTSEL